MARQGGTVPLYMPYEKCYACSNTGVPRDIGDTKYYLCDACYKIHIEMNKNAVAFLKKQLATGENRKKHISPAGISNNLMGGEWESGRGA